MNEKYLRHEIQVDGVTYINFIGKAKDLSDMVKEWIAEDLYRNPCENHRSFYQDDEFLDSLRVADELDAIWLKEDENLYCLSYIDGNGYIDGTIAKVELKEVYL